jgi:hypothetical protein
MITSKKSTRKNKLYYLPFGAPDIISSFEYDSNCLKLVTNEFANL